MPAATARKRTLSNARHAMHIAGTGSTDGARLPPLDTQELKYRAATLADKNGTPYARPGKSFDGGPRLRECRAPRDRRCLYAVPSTPPTSSFTRRRWHFRLASARLLPIVIFDYSGRRPSLSDEQWYHRGSLMMKRYATIPPTLRARLAMAKYWCGQHRDIEFGDGDIS